MDNYIINKQAQIAAGNGTQKSALGGGLSGNSLGKLGEYPADITYRIFDAQSYGSAGGPLSYPVTQPQTEDSVTGYLREIRDILSRMPQMLSLEARTRFPIVPREALSFAAGSNAISVAAGAATAIVTVTLQDHFCGFLTHVGVATDPVGSLPDITWQIRVSGARHPNFSSNIYSVNSIANPMPFIFELTQARVLQLVAINGSAGAINCSGLLLGWTEYMSSYKPYGGNPASGVA